MPVLWGPKEEKDLLLVMVRMSVANGQRDTEGKVQLVWSDVVRAFQALGHRGATKEGLSRHYYKVLLPDADPQVEDTDPEEPEDEDVDQLRDQRRDQDSDQGGDQGGSAGVGTSAEVDTQAGASYTISSFTPINAPARTTSSRTASGRTTSGRIEKRKPKPRQSRGRQSLLRHSLSVEDLEDEDEDDDDA